MNTVDSINPIVGPLSQPIVNLPIAIPSDLAASLMGIIFPIVDLIPRIPILGPVILDIMPGVTGLIH